MWPTILQAVATAMQAGDPHVLAAMGGRELTKVETAVTPSPDRQEPAMFFFVIFG